jgi:hypothetical protein
MDAPVEIARTVGRPVAPAVAWKPVALPVEHGAWSFLLEPVILGLILAPSAAGFCLGIAALAAFLTRHPLRLAALDYRKGTRYPRTQLAQQFTLAYGAVAALFALLAIASAEYGFTVAIVAAAPLALGALVFDLRGRGRDLVAEIAGSIALGASATAIVLAGGGPERVAWMAWLLLALRAVTAIVYVRARLELERTGDSPVFAVTILHALVLMAVLGLMSFQLAPPLAVAAFAILLFRAAFCLLSPSRGTRPQVVGVQEVVFGVATLVLLAIGLS